jgi:hypothetical protein
MKDLFLHIEDLEPRIVPTVTVTFDPTYGHNPSLVVEGADNSIFITTVKDYVSVDTAGVDFHIQNIGQT